MKERDTISIQMTAPQICLSGAEDRKPAGRKLIEEISNKGRLQISIVVLLEFYWGQAVPQLFLGGYLTSSSELTILTSGAAEAVQAWQENRSWHIRPESQKGNITPKTHKIVLSFWNQFTDYILLFHFTAFQ